MTKENTVATMIKYAIFRLQTLTCHEYLVNKFILYLNIGMEILF